jgi:hypothetical protein
MPEIWPVKSLFRETCLDLELRNKKTCLVACFCRQVAKARFLANELVALL